MRVVRHFVVVATIAFVGACGDDPAPRSESAYCGQVAAHLTELNAPVISAPRDIGTVLTAWKSVAAAAPLAIEPEWEILVDALETAIRVDPEDPESLQEVSDTARASEPAAKRIVSYTQERCGLTIGVAP
jgi:hypothetical protein